MTRAPRITGKQVIAKLLKVGFSVTRVKGSHHFPQHPDGRCAVVPAHQGEIIGLGLLSKILHDAELTSNEFQKL
jgi:predicted RNA binding protein YcfA (HicA-like mRNA interferase family)